MPPTARLKNSRVARLMNMSVLPEYRRRGAAHRLLKSIADYAAAYGSEKIMLNASPMGELLYAFFRFERISGGYEFFPLQRQTAAFVHSAASFMPFSAPTRGVQIPRRPPRQFERLAEKSMIVPHVLRLYRMNTDRPAAFSSRRGDCLCPFPDFLYPGALYP